MHLETFINLDSSTIYKSITENEKVHTGDLLVDGNPLEDITIIGGSEKMFDAPDRTAGSIEQMKIIMKDGKIYKNTLSN